MIVTQVQCDELAATMGSPIAVLGTSAQLFSNAPFFIAGFLGHGCLLWTRVKGSTCKFFF